MEISGLVSASLYVEYNFEAVVPAMSGIVRHSPVFLRLRIHALGSVVRLSGRPHRFCEVRQSMIEDGPSFGYCTVASLLGTNKNTVQRISRLNGWQDLSNHWGQLKARDLG